MASDAKQRMLDRDLLDRGISDPAVLAAFSRVAREDFVMPGDRPRAYMDSPLPIGSGQTISQPFIVALTVASLRVKPGDAVLEIGTGSGYEAAILAELGCRVITMEHITILAEQAGRRLARYPGVTLIVGDGSVGHPPGAPYAAIAVSAGAPGVPPSLLAQLAPGGRMVIPVGEGGNQELLLIEKDDRGEVVIRKNICDCRFVPLIGKEGHA
ncbi:MAG: protein-L-isoaspartate(D-aspartate) O-methyltransferase [Planctomycetota bacterium]